MKVLVINAGSSSCKYQLLEMDTETVLASGLAERIGQGMGKLTHKIAPDSDHEEKIVRESAFPTLSLIHISEPTRHHDISRMPSSA